MIAVKLQAFLSMPQITDTDSILLYGKNDQWKF